MSCKWLIPSAASGDVQAYQIRTAPTSAITPGVVMATSPALGTSGGTEEVTRKREVRLMKNRYVTCLIALMISLSVFSNFKTFWQPSNCPFVNAHLMFSSQFISSSLFWYNLIAVTVQKCTTAQYFAAPHGGGVGYSLVWNFKKILVTQKFHLFFVLEKHFHLFFIWLHCLAVFLLGQNISILMKVVHMQFFSIFFITLSFLCSTERQLVNVAGRRRNMSNV